VAAAPAAAPTTTEEINAVVKPLVESAEGALESGASKALSLAGEALGVFGMIVLNPTPTGGPGDTLSNGSGQFPSWPTPDPANVRSTPTPEDAHKTGERESTRGKHEQGEARKSRDRGGEKADAGRRPPRKPPKNWRSQGRGPWPPPPGTQWW
jgi:hypothetical protein